MTWEEVALLPQCISILSEISQASQKSSSHVFVYAESNSLSWKIFHLLPVLVWKGFANKSSPPGFLLNSFYRSRVELLAKGQHEELWKKVST